MNEPNSEKPPRRVRYRGRNPRTYEQKYKEHDSSQYPMEADKVIARGSTPAGTHRPIMVQEIMKVLLPISGDIAVDCTLGYGGHSKVLLAAIQPHGKLIAFDTDSIELPKTETRLREMGYPNESLVVNRTNFAGISGILGSQAPSGVQMILADLGLSSMQIDDPLRGFSFRQDGPLDMRMNPLKGKSASQLLSTLDRDGMAFLLTTNADEPHAQGLAGHILKEHSRVPILSTFRLAEIVRQFISLIQSKGPQDVTDTIRRVFQSLRIAVNDEFSVLDSLLRQIPSCLAPGGRVVILTFHSGEDRRVKHSFQLGLRRGDYSMISEQCVRPSKEEQRSNPRSTSAKLRWAKVAGP